MSTWLRQLRVDPLSALLDLADELSAGETLCYFVRRDLLAEPVGPVQVLWEMPEAQKLVSKQQMDGSWRYPGRNRELHPEINYDLLETFRSLGQLVQKYGFDQQHPAIERAADYVFSCQMEEGDIRGVLGTQYMPYYHAVITELLIAAGYADDRRVLRGLDWLLKMRQDDGGWIVPLQAVPAKEKTRELWSAPPIPPDRSKPHSHMATGMVLRAFAVHPEYRHREEVQVAAECLTSRFFKADKYNDRKAPRYWTKFQFPFWWTNIVTALDSLTLMGFSANDPDVEKGLDWFIANQEENGLWRTGYEQAKHPEMTHREKEAMLWVGLAICRVLGRIQKTGRRDHGPG